MQSQQLLPKGEVLQEEFFSGAKDGEDPAEQMSKAHKHQGIIAKSAPGRCSSKSLILRLCRVLARHSLSDLEVRRPKALLFIEKNAASGIKLFEQVEINYVTSQHHASMFPGGCEEKGVIQGSAPMVFPISLQAGENT